MSTPDQEAMRQAAHAQLKKKQGFRNFSYVAPMVVLLNVAIWYLTSPGEYFWPIWVIVGMGAAWFFVWLDAYGLSGRKPITEADVDAEVERMGSKG